MLVHDSNFGQPSQDKELAFRHPDSAEFLETLLGHLLGSEIQDGVHNDNELPQWHGTSVEDLVQMVDTAREEAYRKAQSLRLGYQVFVCAKQALRDQGIKTSVPNAREESTLELLCRVARGKIMRDISYLVMAVTYVVLFIRYRSMLTMYLHQQAVERSIRVSIVSTIFVILQLACISATPRNHLSRVHNSSQN